MSDRAEFQLPRAPDDLCFKAEDFISPDFDVDNFLHEHRKLATLETMRDDLGVYLKILRSAMIELINKDYADFVNLSKDLIGLDKAIDQLEGPLGQIREEVIQIRQTLECATVEMYNGLEEHGKIREEKQCMHSLGRVYKSITKLKTILNQINSEKLQLDLLERASTEFNQLKFHSSRCSQYISSEIVENVGKQEEELMSTLSNHFLTLLSSKSEIIKDKLSRCLRIYVTLDKNKEAEEFVRRRIVSPAIDSIIVEKNIYNEPRGLQGLYDKLLEVLDNQMRGILESNVESDKPGRGFNFIVNSYWIEVEEKIELRLKSIFAAGNPELFHQRYTETLHFLGQIEKRCENDKILKEYKTHPLYLRFMKKWNLPVYFQIRFQEIAGGVEQILGQPASPGSIKPQVGEQEFALNSTEVTWNSLERTWNDGIFLPQLLHQFWKLNLQICSRFRVWINSSLKQEWIWNSEGQNAGMRSRLEFLVLLFSDVQKLSRKIDFILITAKGKLGELFNSVEDVLKQSLEELRGNFDNDLPKITEEIVKEIMAKSAPSLKQVSDIPRLFRRTMREKPTQACAYVKNAVGSLTEFQGMCGHVTKDVVDHWLLLAVTQLTEQYFSSVKDVLESVQKTEESLRRLKKIRDKSSGTSQPETQGITDDEKIRIQLEIDVNTFCDSVKSFNNDISSIKKLEELKQIVEAAIKNKT